MPFHVFVFAKRSQAQQWLVDDPRGDEGHAANFDFIAPDRHGGDPLHFSYRWNHKARKKFAYHDIKGGFRYVLENDDGS